MKKYIYILLLITINTKMSAQKITNEIQNSSDLNNQQKTVLVSFISKTNQLIPLLTNEDLIERDTKTQINEMTEEIRLLSSNFKQKDYPFETQEQNKIHFRDLFE